MDRGDVPRDPAFVQSLAALGPRICVLGPSNSGKSTLARAIGTASRLEVVHLDQLFHLPGTDWRPRPEAAFVDLHDRAIAADRWVIDGNYTRCMPQRLARATGLILLDVGVTTSLMRYVRRTLFEAGHRAGGPHGDRDSLKWTMLRHIVVTTPANRRRYRRLFEEVPIAKVLLPSRGAIRAFYRAQGLNGRPAEMECAAVTDRVP